MVAVGAERNLRRRRIDGYEQPLALGLLLAALPWRPARRAGRALLALAVVLQADVARSPTVPGANDNATGVAALLALADDPPPGARLPLSAPAATAAGPPTTGHISPGLVLAFSTIFGKAPKSVSGIPG